MLIHAGGRPVTLRALVDSGAQLNLINQRAVIEHDLAALDIETKPTARFLNEHRMTLYKAHRLDACVLDCNNNPRSSKQTFWAGAFEGYDMVLGWDWLEDTDPMISYRQGTFIWNPSADDPIPHDKVSAIFALIEDGSVDFQIGDERWTASPEGGRPPTVVAPPADRVSPEPSIETPDLVSAMRPMSDLLLQGGGDRDPTTLPILSGSDWYVGAVAAYHRLKAVCEPHPDLSNVPSQAYPSLLMAAIAERQELKECYQEYHDVFSDELAGIIAQNSEYDHAIELETGKMPPQMPIYNLSQKELQILREYLDNALAKGWIRPSKSPSGAPILFVPKKDGSMRLCVDYRGLNKITTKNRYPLPLISELLERLSQAKIYSKLDLRDAYHRMRIREGDEWKTAFKTRYGLFEYLVMPFGLANAPATFQSYIHKALGNLVDTTCVVYLDDILIYSGDEESHTQHVRQVLQRLREWGLYAKLSKCQFHTQEVEFLGFIVTPNGVVMDPERVRVIRDWPTPQSFHEVQIFLGFANFYRRFIWGYSQIARPLNDLLRGGYVEPNKNSKKGKKKVVRGKWRWTTAAAEAFDALRDSFSSAPVLRHFDPTKPIMVITDASDAAYAGILLQPDSGADLAQRHWHPVAYHSKSFIAAQVNYVTYDKELIAISECFRTWRHYVEGAAYPIRVLSDHDNLRYFMTTQTLTGRQARIAEHLAGYDFVIEYKKGTANPSDGLSRRPDYFRGFKDTIKRRQLQGMLPTLQQKLRIMELDKASPATADRSEDHRDGCGDSTQSDSQTILSHEQSDQLLAAALATGIPPSPQKRHRAASGTTAVEERIACARKLAGTAGFNLLVPRSTVAAAAVDDNAFVDSPETLISLIRRVQARDAFVQDIRRPSATKSQGTGSPTVPHRKDPGAYAFDEDGLLRRDGRVYVPRSEPLRQELLRRNHDDPVAGHYSRSRTAQVIARKYFWPSLTADVTKYVGECDVCQRVKPKHHKPYGELQSLEPPSRPWRSLSMDFITGLPESKGFNGRVYDSILVVVDRFSKMVRYFAVNKTIDAPALAELIYKKIVMFTGTPDDIVSDRGSVFTSEYWSTLCYHLAVKRRLSTAFHPQTDGQTERLNQQLEAHLRIYCNYDQDD